MTGTVERFGPTRRGGPVFRWLGEPLAIDFANTVMVVREGEEMDLIGDLDGIGRWLDAEAERLGELSVAPDRIGEIRSLRDAVRALLTAVAEQRSAPGWAVDEINAASAAAPVAPRLELGSAGSLRSAQDGRDGDPISAAGGLLARQAIALVTGPDHDRLGICRAPSCGMFFVGARRWCCAACGNRARAARHYRRHAAP